MVDNLEKMSIQDIMYAKAFGIDEDEIKALSLQQMKNEMHNKAFSMRDNDQTISQEESNELNKRLDEIICELMNYDPRYDASIDYYINFDSFVIDNEYYNTFAW